MSKNIENHLARKIPHVHPAFEPQYSDDEMRNHLVKYHGWSLGRIHQRGWTDEGYIHRYHRDAHETEHLDPPSSQDVKEW